MARLLLAEDETILRESLATMLHAWGHEVTAVADGSAALAALRDSTFDLVLTDLMMPQADGRAVLAALRALPDPPEAIVISAYTDLAGALGDVRAGHATYLRKPVERDELQLTVERLLLQRQERQELRALRAVAAPGGIVGQNPALRRLLDTVAHIADSPSTVLIVGESGTGKELVARALHAQSARRDHRFVAIDCGALPETLLESELFGYEKGAFTGAVRQKPGLFEVAEGGTLFLDEIGEASPAIQVKLLRALQDRVIRRLGGTDDIPCAVRVVCATNADLAQRAAAGTFRSDLLYRIRVITLQLPPLRARPEDIPLLMQHFLAKYNALLQRRVTGLADDARRVLGTYHWPGNVRELENAVERAVNLARGEQITADDLPPTVHTEGSALTLPATRKYRAAKAEVIERFERQYFTALLQQTGGTIAQAAAAAGMHRKNLYEKLHRLGIPVSLPDK